MKPVIFLLCLSLLFTGLPCLAEEDVTGIWNSRAVYLGDSGWVLCSMIDFRNTFEMKADGTYLDTGMNVEGTWTYDKETHVITVSDRTGAVVRRLSTLEDGRAFETFENHIILYSRGLALTSRPGQSAAKTIDVFSGNWTAVYLSSKSYFEALDDLEFMNISDYYSSAMIEGGSLSALLYMNDHLIQYEAALKLENGILTALPDPDMWYDGQRVSPQYADQTISVDRIILTENGMICISFALDKKSDIRLNLYYSRCE